MSAFGGPCTTRFLVLDARLMGPASKTNVRFRGRSGCLLGASGIGEINEKRSYLHRVLSPGNGPVLGGPGCGLDSLARRELHGERVAMDLLRRRHRRDRPCPDPTGAPIIVSPFHTVLALVPFVPFWHKADFSTPCINVRFEG